MSAESEPMTRVIEPEVDSSLDAEIKGLLQSCFPKEPQFRRVRFYHEMPTARWMIRREGSLIAHLATHAKQFTLKGRRYRYCGISEVCVIQDQRGRGLVPRLLEAAEDYYRRMSYDYSILLGPPPVYARYGYVAVDNIYFPEESVEPADFAMCKALARQPWPEGKVNLLGPYF